MENTDTTEPQGFDPEVWPLDIATLVKGTEIDPVQMELIRPAGKIGEARYQMELMALSQQLLKQAERRHLPMSFRITHDKIRVMTDSEAADYHDRNLASSLRRMKRESFRQRSLVDRGNLTDVEKEKHARSTALWALRIQAASKPLRALEKAEKQKQITAAGVAPKHPNPFATK